jgi:hypothetical protein
VRSAPGGEYRDSLRRADPYLDLGFIKEAPDANAIRTTLRANVLGEWRIPWWPETQILEAELAAGSTSIPVDLNGEWIDGEQVLLTDGSTTEVLTYTGTTASPEALELEVTSPPGTVNTWPAGTLVVPLVDAILPANIQTNLGYTLESLSITFLRTDGTDLAEESFDDYAGLPVLTDAPKISAGLQGGSGQEIDLIDSSFGIQAIEKISEYHRERRSITFVDSTRADRWARKKLMHWLRGRDRAFWLPSFREDLTLTRNYSSSFLYCSTLGSTAADQALVGEILRIWRISDGFTDYREIDAVVDLGGGEIRLTLDNNPPQSFPASGTRVQIMQKARLDVDEISLEHRYNGPGKFITQISVNAIEVPA